MADSETSMKQRTLELELQLVSAKNLKNVNLFTKMDVYAVVSLDGDAYNGKQKKKTKLAPNCGTNPTFNFTMSFTIDDSLQNQLSLEIKLVSKRILGDKDIGTVHVPLRELFDSEDPKYLKQLTNYRVQRPSGRHKGVLSFYYKFAENVKVVKESEPVMAYPVGASKSTGYSPQQAYGYQAPPVGYPTVQQKPAEKKLAKKKSFGTGFGTGLASGLLIGDMYGGCGCSCGGCGGGGCC